MESSRNIEVKKAFKFRKFYEMINFIQKKSSSAFSNTAFFSSPCSFTYGGTSAFSEAESKVFIYNKLYKNHAWFWLNIKWEEFEVGFSPNIKISQFRHILITWTSWQTFRLIWHSTRMALSYCIRILLVDLWMVRIFILVSGHYLRSLAHNKEELHDLAKEYSSRTKAVNNEFYRYSNCNWKK